jgi:hypothetical protein
MEINMLPICEDIIVPRAYIGDEQVAAGKCCSELYFLGNLSVIC